MLEINDLNSFDSFKDVNIDELSPILLAYIGDAVFSLIIRVKISKVPKRTNEMNQEAKKYVSASGQNDIIQKIKPHLTEKELQIFKRGRNAKISSKAKNAKMSDYLNATGLEALLGYLYIDNNYLRIVELLNIGFSDIS